MFQGDFQKNSGRKQRGRGLMQFDTTLMITPAAVSSTMERSSPV